MKGEATPGREVVLETDCCSGPGGFPKPPSSVRLWTERDPRVPPHRRIAANGRPTVADVGDCIRAAARPSSIGLLAVERKAGGDVIGTAGSSGVGRKRKASRSSRTSCSSGSGVRDTRPRRRGRYLNGRGRLGTSESGPPFGTGTPLLAVCWRRSGSPRRAAKKWSPPMGPISSPRSGSDDGCLVVREDPRPQESADRHW